MKKISRKWQWAFGLTVFAVLVAALAIYDYNKLNANAIHPANLGNELDYIGQRTYGCFLWWCDSPNSTEYYFATNLSEEQVNAYFKGATYVPVPNDGGGMGTGVGGGSFIFHSLTFKMANGASFYLNYYHGIKPTQMDFGLKNTDKSYGISMTDQDFRAAEQALQ